MGSGDGVGRREQCDEGEGSGWEWQVGGEGSWKQKQGRAVILVGVVKMMA